MNKLNETVKELKADILRSSWHKNNNWQPKLQPSETWQALPNTK